jgi:hypothetical protein
LNDEFRFAARRIGLSDSTRIGYVSLRIGVADLHALVRYANACAHLPYVVLHHLLCSVCIARMASMFTTRGGSPQRQAPTVQFFSIECP